jgi:lipoprotein NlpD
MLRAGIWVLLACMAVVAMSGCATKGRPAPVEDRTSGASAAVVQALPGAENMGKPGYYTVKPGDTLIRIGMDHGQSWRDLVRWNSLGNPNLIETGQVLRVIPPNQDTGVVVRPVLSSAPAQATPASAVASAPTVSTASKATNAAAPAAPDSAGKAGDPVLAAADGRVVYAGSGLRGYGNLIILKHNNTYLTAYAHNQTLLVKEDQVIKQGQKIAEMGNSDADQVKLHFEIRRQGKPVDPAKYLPAN